MLISCSEVASEERTRSRPEREVYWWVQTPVEFYSFDADYLQRLETRDPATEDHFVSYFQPLLRIKFRSRRVQSDLVDDYVQETMYRSLLAIRNGGVIREPAKLGAFVSGVAATVLKEMWRKERRQAHEDLEGFEPPAKESSPERMLRQKEVQGAVRLVVAGLSVRDRAILKALYFDELDKDEVCSRMGIDRDGLRLLNHRALKRARKYMHGSI